MIIFNTVRNILIIICLCYGFVCITKIVEIIRNLNYGKNGTTMFDNIKTLSFEEFYTLAVIFLSGKGFEKFTSIEKGLLKCIKGNDEFLVVLDNDMNFFDESDGKIFYGYMLTHNVSGLILFTTGKVETDIKDFFDKLSSIQFIYYDKGILMKDYKEFILNE